MDEKAIPNVGELGINSIRLGGMRIQDLPIAENAIARQQIPLVLDTERQNKINDILVGSPKQRVQYLKGRIRECEDSIRRIEQSKSSQVALITEYSGLISMCKFRDKEIAKVPKDISDREEKIKELKKQFPPYDVKAMKKQIAQSKEVIKKADEVIAREHESIAELREVMVLCERRDAMLKVLGAKIA